MKNVATVMGTRPQLIKAAAVSRAFASRRSEVKEILINTGQHYDKNMSDVFFEELDIPEPHVNLGVGSGSHASQTGEMMRLIERELLTLKPDAVLVYGDTNSTLAGALTASKIHIPVVHVEAGLRSFNRRMPEEINRVLTDHIADMMFAPTQQAVDNLKKEGIDQKKIFLTGDVMYDAVLFYRKKAEQSSKIIKTLELAGKPFVLATIHRAENTDDPARLKAVMATLSDIAKEVTVVFPMHPRTRKALGTPNDLPSKLKIVDAVGYLDMIALQRACLLVITDSGGVQKEAFLNEKFCIVVRPETEWTELVEHGFNFLANPIGKVPELFNSLKSRNFDSGDFKPYGDGHAAEKIVDAIVKAL